MTKQWYSPYVSLFPVVSVRKESFIHVIVYTYPSEAAHINVYIDIYICIGLVKKLNQIIYMYDLSKITLCNSYLCYSYTSLNM